MIKQLGKVSLLLLSGVCVIVAHISLNTTM